jgi:hypothetical protein
MKMYKSIMTGMLVLASTTLITAMDNTLPQDDVATPPSLSGAAGTPPNVKSVKSDGTPHPDLSTDGNSNTPPALEPEDKNNKPSMPTAASTSGTEKKDDENESHGSKDKKEEFKMPFLSPLYRVTKPGYEFFDKLQKNYPKTFFIPACVSLLIASTYCMGKGMDYTSALIKKITNKPKHKETEKLYNDFGTKLGAVIVGHGISELIRYVFNGFTPETSA